MGNQQDYVESGGFYRYLYDNHPNYETIEINGVRGEVIYHTYDPNYEHYSLPSYADTSDMYFKEKKGEIIQGRLFIDRKSVLDFDWGHTHTNKSNGQTFTKGIVHVQEYSVDSNGKLIRLSDNARLAKESEIAKYGPLILAFNPNVRFR